MKFLEDILEKKVKPLFTKGGKLEKFYYAFEAGESFHFVTDKKTDTGAHIRDHVDLKRMMITVVLAMVPCILFGIYNIGYQQLYSEAILAKEAFNVDYVACFIQGLLKYFPLMLTIYATGGTIEAIFAVTRKHEINEGFLVTGMLVTLIMPPTIPLWQAAAATAFGVLIGKEVFGGTGMNIMNPALTARAFAFFAFPQQMSGDMAWVVPKDSNLLLNGLNGIDAVSVATPLAQAANSTTALSFTDAQLFWGLIPGSIGETSVFCLLLGAAILIFTGVASWRTMLGTVIGGLVIASLFHYVILPMDFITNKNTHIFSVAPMTHLLLGGFAFGTVFMCTDPVSSANTNTGKWIFGFCVGALAITIRCVNPAYPEGMMLAILFMNVFAPLIDHYVVRANVKRRLNRGTK